MGLKEKIRALPSSPGVYLMKDAHGGIIYVGKSKNLKSRVGSYFQNSVSHSPKVLKLVRNIKTFDFILTDTEFEAFLLECKLIKETKPIYNRLMKSPNSYTFIKINYTKKYPDIEIAFSKDENDGNLYFGPYTSKNTVERAIQGIKESCKILCTSNFRKSSACLNYSLGLCIGICIDDHAKECYLKILDKIVQLICGNDKSIIETIEYNMNTASEKLDFEKAAKYRDYLGAVNYLINKVKVIEYIEENKNIALVEFISDEAIKFFLIKGNKVLYNEKYEFHNSQISNLTSILKGTIFLYLGNQDNNSLEIGREEVDESQIIYSYLKNKSNNCKYVVISERWLKDPDNPHLDNALNQLLISK